MSRPSSDVGEVLKQRGPVHGEASLQFVVAQQMKTYMRHLHGWNTLTELQREALDMVMLKVSRILTGDPNHLDHWTDIAGYATIVAQRIK